MKKFLLVFVLAISFASLSFGSVRIKPKTVSNTEIANTIESAAEFNRSMGVENPDLIYPEQYLYYPMPPYGDVMEHEVVAGENQSMIVKNMLYDRLYNVPGNNGQASFDRSSGVSFNDRLNDFMDALRNIPIWKILLGLGILILLALLVRMVQSIKSRNVDPVTAGTAQVPGGVRSEKAHSRIQEIAVSRFPGATIAIKNIRRGTLSGLANVHYAGNLTKKINLRDVPAYAGEILVNGKEQTIYFLQGCGNDARNGDYFSGTELTFVPKVLINENGTESAIGSTSDLSEETNTEKQKPEIVGSESFKFEMNSLGMLKEIIVAQQVHEFKLSKGPNSFEMNVKFKFGVDKESDKKN